MQDCDPPPSSGPVLIAVDKTDYLMAAVHSWLDLILQNSPGNRRSTSEVLPLGL